MLNFTLKGTYQDPSGFSWDYYGDDTNSSNFYIVPRPQFVLDNAGKPSFQITRYKTNDASNGAGFCRFDIELSVPAEVETAIKDQIPQKFPDAKSPYFFLALDYNPNGKAYFDFASGASAITFSAPVSSFGSNVASFLLKMTKEQLDTVISAFSTSGGGYEVELHLSVPAPLPAVTAVLSFDSSIAYQYQVTQPSYNSWGDQTSPESVQKLLTESAASTVKITWGTQNPSSDLEQAVADWANDTLSDLISAEVEKTIQLQGLQSGNSFNINEVSSFTSTYSQNMVINWIIAPQAELPSFPSLSLDVNNFVGSVNEQQQQMAVSVFLPFKSDSTGSSNIPAPTLPDGRTVQALVKSATVTVTYPGLPEANASYTFTKNENHIFATAYNEQAGPNWNLTYTVIYEDTGMASVSGAISNIDAVNYTLQVEEAGILTVTFDAAQAFATEGTQPTEINIAFSYISNSGQGSPINQEIKIKQTDTPQQGKISSFQSLPIDSKYNYQVTYVYIGSVQFQAPLMTGQTGFSQIIPAANAIHSCTLIVYVPSVLASSNPVFDATVQMWYQQAPTLPPGVNTQPTKNSPAVFTITPNPDANGSLFGRATFDGLINGDQPLVYTAAIDAASGQINIPETLLNNSQPSVMVSPTQRYFTLEISPAAINWTTATFQRVEVLVTLNIAQGTATSLPGQLSQQTFIWNKDEQGSKYLTYGITDGNSVTYAWEVNYVIQGQPVKTQSATGATDLILNIPATPAP